MKLQPFLMENSLLYLSKVEATHCRAIKSSYITNTYAANSITHSYAQCKELNLALKLFEEMNYRDTASWNTIITAYVNSRNFIGAWEVLKSMKKEGFLFDGYTFGSMLKGTAIGGRVVYGQQVHSDVVKMGFDGNVHAVSSLLNMYAKCGKVEDASLVFEHMFVRNAVSYNGLIGGYADVDDFACCFQLFRYMEEEGVTVDDATFVPILTMLDNVEFYGLTRQIHGKIMKLGLEFKNTVLNAMITAYSDCGCIYDASKMFSNADGYRDLVTWNSMLAAYLQHGLEECGFSLFQEMMRLRFDLDSYSYSTIISACIGETRQISGKSFHSLVVKRGLEQLTVVSNALISMYLNSKCCDEESAAKVFEHMASKDLVSWNSILTSLSQNGLSEYALKLYHRMHLDDLDIDQYTLAAVLRSCSNLAVLNLGRQIHGIVIKSGFEENEYVSSAAIFMYSKCGVVEDAWKFFVASQDSPVTWNTIIFAYAQHGQSNTALSLFYLMAERQIKMDHITFVAVLTACSHVGLVEEGLNLLWSMEPKYGVLPRMENFACAVDLLGRAGHLVEAKELVKEMPFEPDAMVLKTLLGACRACGDIESASWVANCLLELEPHEHCTYILLSDMYGNLKRWEEKASVKRLMRQKGVKKVPAWSWIELHGVVHAFNADDNSHKSCQDIYLVLKELVCEMKRSDTDTMLECLLDDINLAVGCFFVGDTGQAQYAYI